MRQPVTQIQIAKAVGVSQRAVSSVVGRTGDQDGFSVSEATRRRILEMAGKLGYRPQRQAQFLRGVKSGVIGIIKSISMSQSSVERQYHASLAIQREGYGLLAQEMLWGDDRDEIRAVENLLDAKVEGVLVSLGAASPAILTRLQQAKIPMVSLGGIKSSKFPYFGADHGQGMQDMVRHLLSLGRRRLAFELGLGPGDRVNPATWSLHARLTAFRKTCASAGLSKNEARVIWQPRRTPSFDQFQFGQQAARTLLEEDDLPDALICQNDIHATGAQKVLLDHGVSIPHTLALTGFDNTAIGQQLMVPLTSVDMPIAEMANQAVEMLVQLIRGETRSEDVPKSTLLPCKLVIRESCGATVRQPNPAH